MLSWNEARIQLPVHYPWNTSLNVCLFLCGSGCLSRIRYFPSRIPDPGLTRSRLPVPASKNWSIFNSKISSGVFIPDPISRVWIFSIPDPGSRGQKSTGSRIRIRNTAWSCGIWQEAVEIEHYLRIRIILRNHGRLALFFLTVIFFNRIIMELLYFTMQKN